MPPTATSQTPEPTTTAAISKGWVSQPNTRGTLDIIWTCLVATFLCTFTVLCLNVPSKSEARHMIYFRKFRWMLLAIAGPEFVLGFAAGQYENAYKAVNAFRDRDHTWSMRHAFFAEMGGFHLHPRDSTPFPVNNQHILWLMDHGYMGLPPTHKEDIWDKSKADSLIKFIVSIQIGWMLLNVLARAAQDLTITTLELGTVSIVVISICIHVTWLHKPADVMTPIPIHIQASTAEILCAAGDAARKPYAMTPLDFVDNMGPSWTANALAFANIRAGPRRRPLPRFTNDRFPHVRGPRYTLLVVMTLFGVGIHLFGWNFWFPTRGEQIAWRVASLQMLFTAAFFWAVEIIAGWKRDNVMELWYCMVFTPGKLEELKERRRLRPPRPQPTPADFPLRWECGVSATMALLYMIARVYTLVEMFAGLRELPANAYNCVEWVDFFPHI
ncbi:hypothetical protein BDW62DRAFT_16531 [Aspergillus aurantiobrunneus]